MGGGYDGSDLGGGRDKSKDKYMILCHVLIPRGSATTSYPSILPGLRTHDQNAICREGT